MQTVKHVNENLKKLMKDILSEMPTAKQAGENMSIEMLLMECFNVGNVHLEDEIKQAKNKSIAIECLKIYKTMILSGTDKDKSLNIFRELIVKDSLPFTSEVLNYIKIV